MYHISISSDRVVIRIVRQKKRREIIIQLQNRKRTIDNWFEAAQKHVRVHISTYNCNSHTRSSTVTGMSPCYVISLASDILTHTDTRADKEKHTSIYIYIYRNERWRARVMARDAKREGVSSAQIYLRIKIENFIPNANGKRANSDMVWRYLKRI